MDLGRMGVAALSAVWSRATRIAREASPPPVRVEGIRVLSIGALAAGGSGKTPLAIEIASRLRDRGVPTAIVLRGHRGSASGEGALVSDGTRIVLGALAAGDEAVLAARRVPGALVRIGRDRAVAAAKARAEGARAVVLDDGFQERRLVHDVDVVAVDAVPRASVVRRESEASLDRATLLAVRGAAELPPDPRAFVFALEPEALVDAGLAVVGPPSLRGRRVVVACGIARPERFLSTVRALGATVAAQVLARDHAPVAGRAAQVLARARADAIVTTEKDLVREPLVWARLPVLGVRASARLGAGASRLDALLE
jgi:tetraacyldisaccharide 4'-kinase